MKIIADEWRELPGWRQCDGIRPNAEPSQDYSELEQRIAEEVIATGQMLNGDPPSNIAFPKG